MHELDRRSMLKVVAALSLGPYSALADEKESTLHFVEAGTDRTGQPHKAARANSHLDFKVLTHETNGALFIMENRNMVRGGPPRHIHYEQGCGTDRIGLKAEAGLQFDDARAESVLRLTEVLVKDVVLRVVQIQLVE